MLKLIRFPALDFYIAFLILKPSCKVPPVGVLPPTEVQRTEVTFTFLLDMRILQNSIKAFLRTDLLYIHIGSIILEFGPLKAFLDISIIVINGS